MKKIKGCYRKSLIIDTRHCLKKKKIKKKESMVEIDIRICLMKEKIERIEENAGKLCQTKINKEKRIHERIQKKLFK